MSYGRLGARRVLLAAVLVTPDVAMLSGEDLSQARDRCSKKAEELFGQAPPSFEVGDSKESPKLLRSVKPSFPDNSRTACSMLLHEALVSPSGSVVTVWPVRRPQEAECTDFQQAAIKAIRQWKYEPYVMSKKAVPFCVTLMTSIHLVSR